MSQDEAFARVRAELLEDVLRRRGRVTFHADGRSMRPVLPPGCEVTVRAMERPARVGDVVLARVEGRLTLHRVIRRRSDGRVVLQGDAMPYADPPVRSRDVLGRVVSAPGAWGPVDDALAGRAWARVWGGIGAGRWALMARLRRLVAPRRLWHP